MTLGLSKKTEATAFVLDSPQSVIAECIRSRGYDVFDVLVLPPRLGRLRRAHMTRRLPLQRMWFHRNFRILEGTETVVIFDRPEMFAIARRLTATRPDVRVIIWLWNPLPADWRPPADLDSFEVVTFDPADAERFGFRSNSTFYFRELGSYASGERDHDLIFVGRDKGRRAFIEGVATALTHAGSRVALELVDDAGRGRLSYREVLERTGRSRGVLDVVQAGQRGLTLRSMEALFLDAKLLTNNPAVLAAPHFPHQNVLVLDGQQPEALLDFLREDPVVPSAAALEYYDFAAWLRRLTSG
ncbi:hypothetical protein [Ornithinimicrobium cryptoxanthini]|uniref:hypothetical protein n=1 Tax=Ornithinimicrobium cryptoxanthini TaxID=2934161 RepID=UPI0021193C90|nr:hypothetical protein [Ornithinimicrobium cryptoxanthini]